MHDIYEYPKTTKISFNESNCEKISRPLYYPLNPEICSYDSNIMG